MKRKSNAHKLVKYVLQAAPFSDENNLSGKTLMCLEGHTLRGVPEVANGKDFSVYLTVLGQALPCAFKSNLSDFKEPICPPSGNPGPALVALREPVVVHWCPMFYSDVFRLGHPDFLTP